MTVALVTVQPVPGPVIGVAGSTTLKVKFVPGAGTVATVCTPLMRAASAALQPVPVLAATPEMVTNSPRLSVTATLTVTTDGVARVALMRVTGVDRDAQALSGLNAWGEVLQADLEHGIWPLQGRQFDLVVVSNYLWRPRLPELLACVAPNGWLIYETFAMGQQSIGRPSRPDFLLQAGELLKICSDLKILGYEDGFLEADTQNGVSQRYVQRVAAVKQAFETGIYPRYLLS